MFGRGAGASVEVSELAVSANGAVRRAGANAGGTALWFETAGFELRAAPEAFGSALLLQALTRRSTLVLDGAVGPTWYRNVQRLLEVFHEWWDYPPLMPQVAVDVSLDGPQGAATALCFSGGVDSFYTLLRSGRRVDVLAAVHGFDVPLADGVRAAAMTRSVEAVARAVGARPVIVRTNLREHPLARSVNWERVHGGALAAIGHSLGGDVGTLLISSSYPYDSSKPWGSHWRTDPLWSSGRLRVTHVGAETRRSEKLPLIAAEPLVREHLRVCWENHAPVGNCSRCEKCLRTMVTLSAMKVLDEFPVFDGEAALVGHLDALPHGRWPLRQMQRHLAQGTLRPEVDRAVRALLERTRAAQERDAGAVARGARLIRRVLGWVRR